MRNILFLVSFLLCFTVSAQDDALAKLQRKLSKDTCNCFDKESAPNENTLKNCIEYSMEQNETDFKQFVDPESELSEFEQGEKLGYQMFMAMQPKLIQECDSYYNLFENLRDSTLENLKKDYVGKLDSLTTEVGNKSEDALWHRGNYYFTHEQRDLAKLDYIQCLDMSPDFVQTHLFLGWLYEKEEEYDKAIEHYNKVIEMTGKQEIVLFVEIAKRKAKG